MSTAVTYLFGPLCGWCYGASTAIQRLAHESAIALHLRDASLTQAADVFSSRGHDVVRESVARVQPAQTLLQANGIEGVPTLIVANDKQSRLLRDNALYGGFEQLLKAIFA